MAVWADDACCPVDADVRAATRGLVARLRAAGCAVVDEGACPFDAAWGWEGGAARAFEVYKRLLAAEENLGMGADEIAALKKLQGEVDTKDDPRASDLHEEVEWITQSVQSWHAADAARQDLRRAYDKFFERYDVLVCPICASVAWTKDESGAGDHEWLRRPVLGGDAGAAQHFWRIGRRVIAGAAGHRTPYHAQVFWSGVTNVGGHPATAFPAGRAASVEGRGMPVGLQAVGAEWNDLTTIGFAEALETELGYAFLPPEGY